MVSKLAVTAVGALTVRLQERLEPKLEQAPDHSLNSDFVPAAARKVTEAPSRNLLWHTAPQSMPVGSEEIVPTPPPALVTKTSYWGIGTKLAVTRESTVIAIVQVLAVPQDAPAPAQPMKRESLLGVAASVVVMPSANSALQPFVPSHAMAAGSDVTVPPPPPESSTVSS
jgi:hypothetical protein